MTLDSNSCHLLIAHAIVMEIYLASYAACGMVSLELSTQVRYIYIDFIMMIMSGLHWSTESPWPAIAVEPDCMY